MKNLVTYSRRIGKYFAQITLTKEQDKILTYSDREDMLRAELRRIGGLPK